jgi:hypothetical protein
VSLALLTSVEWGESGVLADVAATKTPC